MNAPLWFSSVQTLNTNFISKVDLTRIFEIEKDMWAREDWLWEYIKCNNCNFVASKEDIYWNLSSEIKNETVSHIEKILCNDTIFCPKCDSSNTDFLFWDNYIDEILDRFKNSESYLSVFRDNNWIIRWFVDWYIDRFSKIYKREFQKYYEHIWEDNIVELIEETIKKPLPNELFYCSAIWIETKYKNFKVIIKLLQDFFASIKDNWRNIIGVSELKIGSSIHRLNSLFWAKKIWINNIDSWVNISNHKDWVDSDIFVNEQLVDNYRKSLSIPTRELVIKIKNQAIL